MPLEGHAQRLATPLARRDRRFIAAVACATVIGVGACAYAYASRPAAPSSKGCVVVTVASSLGGTTLRYCGASARTFCRGQGRASAGIAEACRSRDLQPKPPFAPGARSPSARRVSPLAVPSTPG